MWFGKVFKWVLIILFLAALAGGMFGYSLWNESEQILHRSIVGKLNEVLPEWTVSLGRARFDWSRRIHLYDVTLRAADGQPPLLTVPEVIVTVDRDRLSQEQAIDVQKIRVIGAVVDLVRGRDGRWNWQSLAPLQKTDRSCPEWRIEQGTVRITLEHADGAEPSRIVLSGADVDLFPSGKRQFLIKGQTQVNRAGQLQLDGRWDMLQESWSCEGRMNDVNSSGELSSLAVSVSPELRAKVAKFAAMIEQGSSRRGALQVRPVSATGQAPPLDQLDPLPQLGISGAVDVGFAISQAGYGSEPDFKMLVHLRQGQLDNPLLPFPLHEMDGTVYWDNQQLLIQQFHAKNGVTRVGVEGRLVRQAERTPGQFTVEVKQLVLDERLRDWLPEQLQKQFDSVQPAGLIDLKGQVAFDGESAWQTSGFLLQAHDCTATVARFPLTVRQISGEVQQRGRDLEIQLSGFAGKQPVRLDGYIKQAGPEAEAILDVAVDQLPLGEAFLDACTPPMRTTLKTLGLKGAADVRLRLFRPAGADQRFHAELAARLQNGTLEYLHFPYRLTGVSGRVTYSTAKDDWEFSQLQAQHGAAKLAGAGTYRKVDDAGRLDLQIEAQGAEFDRSLSAALPPALQEVWDNLCPAGSFDAEARVVWSPGGPPVITLPKLQVAKGSIVLAAFPYPLENVEAELTYTDGLVQIASFSAEHDRTKVSTTGYVEWNAQRDWRVHFDELYADDLEPDRIFRRALPAGFRAMIEQVDPQGPLSLAGSLEFRGARPEAKAPVTAAWDLEVVLAGERLTTGVELSEIHGRVLTRGAWDGAKVQMNGDLDLDSIVVKGYQFTQVQGPLALNNRQFVLGSAEALLPEQDARRAKPLQPEERVTARAIGGLFTIDAAALLQEETSWHLKMTMSQARLEDYAARYMAGKKNLRGIINGWVDLHGRGPAADRISGRGQVQASPAALYELPIIVQMFNALTLIPQEKAAFKYAFVDFNIAASQFLFNAIELAGDAISFRGRGAAGFDGRLNLDFYSMMPRNTLPIPVVNVLVGEATKGWVGIEVGGKISAPVATVKAVPTIDGALKKFLGAFDGRPAAIAPGLLIPPINPQPGPTPRPRTP